MVGIVRFLRIGVSRLSELSLGAFFTVFRGFLFRSDPILIFKLDLGEPSKGELEGFHDVDILKGSHSELDRSREQLRPLPWEFQCHHYDGVEDFFIARNIEGIQHISWIYYRKDPNRILLLKEREAEIKYCLTLAPFRGRGLYPRVLAAIAHFLRRRGFSRVFICVRADNHPSIRGIEKAGFTYAAQVQLRKCFGVQLSRKVDTGGI
jgi:RimJ/RimL family protein N-acetyltransferase